MDPSVVELYKGINIINVVNDSFETLNIKGSVNRNRTLMSALINCQQNDETDPVQDVETQATAISQTYS